MFDYSVILARKLMPTLRNRELAQAAKDIPPIPGWSISLPLTGRHRAGSYRHEVMLAIGRYTTAE